MYFKLMIAPKSEIQPPSSHLLTTQTMGSKAAAWIYDGIEPSFFDVQVTVHRDKFL